MIPDYIFQSCKDESWTSIAKYLKEDVPLLVSSQHVDTIERILDVVFKSLPSNFNQFIRWMAEIRRTEDINQNLSSEEESRLDLKVLFPCWFSPQLGFPIYSSLFYGLFYCSKSCWNKCRRLNCSSMWKSFYSLWATKTIRHMFLPGLVLKDLKSYRKRNRMSLVVRKLVWNASKVCLFLNLWFIQTW